MMTMATSTLIVLGNLYLPAALLISVGTLLLAALVRWESARVARAPERWLGIGWVLLALALILPGAWAVVGGETSGGRAPLEIWSGAPTAGASTPVTRLSLSWGGAPARLPKPDLAPGLGASLALGGALGVGALITLVQWTRRRRRLGRLCLHLPVVKKVGRVRVCASDVAAGPFAAAYQGVAFIVVPTSLLTDLARLRQVIAHEAHHHRRGDLQAAALLGMLRTLFFWNPLLARCERTFAELQDFACDRWVLERGRASPQDYGRTLLWAAEAAQGQRYLLSVARGIADGSTASLTRRIVALGEPRREQNKRDFRSRAERWSGAAAAAALLLGISWGVHGAVIDHRVTRSRAEALAARIAARAGFPVLVDERVVDRLNQYLAVPEAREQIAKAMERMPAYRGMIEETLRRRGLPVELLAVVMAESRFDNEAHPNTPVERRSVGIWQITPATGRQLGLQISPVLDERLEPRRATDAAVTLLAQLYARYRDWPLAIAAYNAGEKKIDALTAGTRSKDEARARVLAGEEEHARYLRAVMAGLILIDDPTLSR